MNAEQAKIINELCEIYHRLDCNRQIDTVMITLLLSLLGYAPVGDILPQTVQGSINAFRRIGHQERYNFTMSAISTLLGNPSTNPRLRDLFEQLNGCVAPVSDSAGQNVLQNGHLFFGPYKNANLIALIFEDSST